MAQLTAAAVTTRFEMMLGQTPEPELPAYHLSVGISIALRWVDIS